MNQSLLELSRRIAALEAAVFGPPEVEPLPAINARGAHRAVYTVRPGVVRKTPIHAKGKIANQLEAVRWARREEMGLADWLCPVITDCDEYIEMLQGTQSDHVPDHPDHVRALVDTDKAANWVVIRGRHVLCDYGHPHGGATP